MVERLVCATPALSAADDAMAAAYRAALAAVSPASRVVLRDRQRAFLAQVAGGCVPGRPLALTSHAGPTTRAACMTDNYTDRARVLRSAVQRASGHVFLILPRIRVRATHASDDGNLPPAMREDSTLVQIDSPRNAGERAWNAAMRRWLAEGADLAYPGDRFEAQTEPGTADIDIAVTAASPDLISAMMGVSTYSGGAHPNYTSRQMLWSIPRARALAIGDLFADPASPRLRALVTAHYGAGGYPTHDGCDAPDVTKFLPTVDPKGILFGFDPYVLGAYTCGGESPLSWAEAAPYLRRPLPFAPGALAVPVPIRR